MGNLMELIWAFLINHETDWGVLRHTHEYFQMYYCLSGRGTVLLDNQPVVLEKDGCLIIWPQQLHEVLPVEGEGFCIIDTTFCIHSKPLEHAVYQAPQHYPVADPGFRDMQKNMQNEWDAGAWFSKEMAELLFCQSILLLLRSAARSDLFSPANDPCGESAPSRAYQALNKLPKNILGTEKLIVDYLSAHFLENLTLDKIAQDLHYSKNYLCKAFTNTTGYTIKQYVNYLRINHSYDLVCFTKRRFSEIAAQCGFSSIHYFSRTFHRIVGITPTQARARSSSTDFQFYGPRQYRYHNKSSHKEPEP